MILSEKEYWALQKLCEVGEVSVLQMQTRSGKTIEVDSAEQEAVVRQRCGRVGGVPTDVPSFTCIERFDSLGDLCKAYAVQYQSEPN